MPYIPEEIEAYADRFTSPRADLFDRLAAETRETQDNPQMMVGHVEGAFLSFLVTLSQARRVLEVGTFTGWSSIAMAGALPPDGSIVSCDINEETTAVARRYAEEAGVADRIDYRLGPATETLATLDGPFDLVFIDADKVSYDAYYEAVLPKLAPHGLIVVDNTLQSGGVLASESNPHEGARALRAFNDKVVNDPRVVCVLTTVRDGVTLIRRAAPARDRN
ncbi:MAG TPA: class I SAM-dependent methyltransferase [Gaiellaceae bacterium]|nr:class I SAM-dependent methyltransferase [Gaiellaceae bacterium]